MPSRFVVALLALAPVTPLSATGIDHAATNPAPNASDAVTALVDRFDAARTGFHAEALAATLAPDYQEISPVGDVDSREEVIGFYRSDKRIPSPDIKASERNVVAHGDWALMTERRSFDIQRPGGQVMTRSLRVRYVAVRHGRSWQLVSAQFTPIPAR